MENYVEKIEAIGEKTLRLYSNYATPEELRHFKKNIEDDVFSVVRKTKPVVMFYGVYNAGKSTLINAILGREAAAVSSKPETAVVTPYDWNGFELWDSPGIDAPLDHEKLSKEKLRQCDLVLFVVSSEGTFESKKNYRELADLISDARKFLIVLNDKGGYEKDSHEIKLIIAKIFENLINYHGKEIAKKYSVVYVNAKRALKGRREDKKYLIEKSEILELEERILIEVRSASFSFLKFANALRNLMKSCYVIQERINKEMEKYSTQKVKNIIDEIQREKTISLESLRSFIREKFYRIEDRLALEIVESESPQAVMENYYSSFRMELEQKTLEIDRKLQRISKVS